MFGPWNRVESTIHPYGFSHNKIQTPPRAPKSAVTIASDHTTLYSRQLQQYSAFGIFVSVRKMRVILTLLDGPNQLWDSEPINFPNVVHLQVESHVAGRPDLRGLQSQVKMVTIMLYWLGETYDHIFHTASDSTY